MGVPFPVVCRGADNAFVWAWGMVACQTSRCRDKTLDRKESSELSLQTGVGGEPSDIEGVFDEAEESVDGPAADSDEDSNPLEWQRTQEKLIVAERETGLTFLQRANLERNWPEGT